jgi:membrane fusion protein, multidrug efflux system
MNLRIEAPRIILPLVLVALAGVPGCSDHRAAPAPKPETVIGVSVIAVQTSTVPQWLEAVGTLRAAQTSQVASQMMGTIVEIRAHEGDHVQAGQVLAIIDDSQQLAAVQQSTAASVAAQKEFDAADAELVLAAATLQRYRPLFEKSTVSPREFDEIRTRHASALAHREMARAGQAGAEAALTQARNALGYTRIRAPFAGVITEKKADVGTMAVPGMAIFTVEDTYRYRLEATVDESDLAVVHLGQEVSVVLDALGDAAFRGKIVQMVPAADPASHGFLVKIELPADTRVRSGLFGRARISRGQRTALLIPQTALVQRGQLHGVYVVDLNGAAHLAYITLGRTVGPQIEVLSGISDGEKLIAVPGDRDFARKQVAMTQ